MNYFKVTLIAGLLTLPTISMAETTLKVWWVEREELPILQEIDKELPDIKLEIKVLDINELNQDLIKAASSGRNLPDIVNIDNPFYAWAADNKILRPLDDYIAKSTTIKMDNYYRGPRSTVTWKDHVYGVPNSTNTIVLFYNKADFREVGLNPDKPPQTWDELYDYAKKLTNPSKNRFGLYFAAPATEEGTFQILPWIQMTGANWDHINTPGTVEVLKYLKRFLDEGLTSKDALVKGQDAGFLTTGQTSMIITGPWALKDIRASKIDWGVTTLPISSKYNIHASALGGLNVGIPAKAEHPEAAFKFIEALAQKQDRLWNEVGYLTPRSDVITKNPNEADAYKVIIDQMQYARARGPHPQWPKISQAIYRMFQDALTGRRTAEDAVKRAEKEIAKVTKK